MVDALDVRKQSHSLQVPFEFAHGCFAGFCSPWRDCPGKSSGQHLRTRVQPLDLPPFEAPRLDSPCLQCVVRNRLVSSSFGGFGSVPRTAMGDSSPRTNIQAYSDM